MSLRLLDAIPGQVQAFGVRCARPTDFYQEGLALRPLTKSGPQAGHRESRSQSVEEKDPRENQEGIAQNMDGLDVEILQRLSQDARKSYLEIARELNVANATVHERISKLKEKGILKGFYTRMSAEKLGRPITAFVGLITSQNKQLHRLVERLKQIEEIEEAHTVTGKYDFLIKLRARSNDELQELLNRIGSIPGSRST